MNILHNVWTVISTIGFILGFFSGLLSTINFIKKLKGFNMKSILENPYKKVLLWSLCLTIIFVILFYIFGGFETINKQKKPLITNPVRGDVSIKTIKLDTPQKEIKKPSIVSHKKGELKKIIVQTNKTGDNIVGNGNNKGKNNFNGGKNNTYGAPIHVGDDYYVNADKKLTDAGLLMVKKSIDSLRSIYKIPKVISIGSYGNCNAPLMLGQLQDYFNTLGYHVDGGGSAMSNVFRYGFIYGRQDDSTRVTLDLGYFK